MLHRAGRQCHNTAAVDEAMRSTSTRAAPELQDAGITATPFYIMDGSVFLPVCDVNQDISIADAHVQRR